MASVQNAIGSAREVHADDDDDEEDGGRMDGDDDRGSLASLSE